MEFHPAHRYSPLTELTLLHGSRLVRLKSVTVAGVKQVLTGIGNRKNFSSGDQEPVPTSLQSAPLDSFVD
jgi:hypothetical protein